MIEPMSEQDITILPLVFKNDHGKKITSRLYYYQGNFYYPLEGLPREIDSRIKNMIQLFKKKHNDMIKKDRSHPHYKNKLQLFDEQMKEFADTGG